MCVGVEGGKDTLSGATHMRRQLQAGVCDGGAGRRRLLFARAGAIATATLPLCRLSGACAERRICRVVRMWPYSPPSG